MFSSALLVSLTIAAQEPDFKNSRKDSRRRELPPLDRPPNTDKAVQIRGGSGYICQSEINRLFHSEPIPRKPAK